jgi:GTP diphosphokinase / guanosine-3',5'-bis(diphosphate) 3'-diphosphatase
VSTTISNIVETIRSYSPDADLQPVMSAYLMAAKAHAGQTRKTGEPYLTHPLAVAQILADMRMDTDTIATALLHDALEDNPITKREMETQIGPEITALVDGVTKIGKLRFRSQEELAAENFRKMMLAMSRDLRVILVKLADRTHNLRTLDGHRPEKQRMVARETMDIFVPIANRLGLHRIKSELEDICFRALHPDDHAEIRAFLARTEADRERTIHRICEELRGRLVTDGIDATVTGRAKQPWSIWRKMRAQGLQVDEVHDLIAFRVIVADLAGCYAALGLVHSYYPPVPDRIKDYIARPKPNGYQSLHTTVVGPGQRRMEVQIRTREMHRVNEEGIAAHWRYKEGRLALSRDDVASISRIRDLFEHAKDAETATDFMEALKVEFYADEVFVFTPAGDIRTFPAGATALDFAYAVHTEVGHHCTGAKVNGRMVPLRYALESGDTVEILTASHQKPNRGWLEIARTGRAVQKIRRFLRKEERELGVKLGREMLEAELKRLGSNLGKARSTGKLNTLVQEHGADNADAVYLDIARGQLGLADATRALLPEGAYKAPGEHSAPLGGLFGRWGRRSESPVLITGEDGVLVHFARCCQPLPGEPVAGYVTRGRGITVHRGDCEQLKRSEPERRISVEWDLENAGRHTSELQIHCEDRPGMLADISKVCEQAQVNINKVEARSIDADHAICTLSLSVHDVGEMDTLSANLRKVRGVESVQRIGA